MLLAFCLVCNSATADAQSARPQPTAPIEIEIDPSPDAVVLRLTETPGALVEMGGGPTVTVFGDGRVLVERPPYMRDPGQRTLQLDAQELDALVRSTVERGVADFDAPAVRRARRVADAERAGRMRAQRARPSDLQHSSDATSSRFELRLRRYRGADGKDRRDVARELEWKGLREDARRHPGIRALGQLDAVRADLRALARRAEREERR